MVQKGGTHANQCSIMDGAGMNSGIVTDGYVIADDCGTCAISDMTTTAVLYIGAIPDGDRCNIATYYGIKPYRAFIAHCHFANYCGSLTEIAITSPFRSETFYTFYLCHIVSFVF